MFVKETLDIMIIIQQLIFLGYTIKDLHNVIM